MSEICPTCLGSTSKYWHKLTPGLVQALVKAYMRVCEKGENVVHKNELELDHSEYGNFQKLRFHALIARYKRDGIAQRSTWLITKRGARFLKGDYEVPARVQTFRNAVVAHSDIMVDLTRVMKSDPYWEGYEDFAHKHNIEFPDGEDTQDVQTIKTVKKKKGKEYCPDCEEQLKITYDEKFNKFLVCPRCGHRKV